MSEPRIHYWIRQWRHGEVSRVLNGLLLIAIGVWFGYLFAKAIS